MSAGTSESHAPQPPPGPVSAWRAMLEAHRDVVESLASEFRTRHQLSVSDFDVLINIGPDEEVRHRELADRVVLSRSALSRLIDRLVARDLLTRRKVEADSRGVLIALTPAGKTLREEAARSNDTVVVRAFTALGPDEVDVLQRLATKITHSGAPTLLASPNDKIEEKP